jgi:hypothetical protein
MLDSVCDLPTATPATALATTPTHHHVHPRHNEHPACCAGTTTMVVTTTATNTSIAFTANFIARSGTIAGAVDRTAPLSPPHFVWLDELWARQMFTPSSPHTFNCIDIARPALPNKARRTHTDPRSTECCCCSPSTSLKHGVVA